MILPGYISCFIVWFIECSAYSLNLPNQNPNHIARQLNLAYNVARLLILFCR